MADNLQIFGSTFNDVVGIKASNTGGTVLTFLNSADFLPLSGGTLTGDLTINNAGTLNLLKTTDASGTTANAVPLIIGAQTSQHIEMDTNEILCKSDGTTPTTLYLQDSTGTVEVSGSGGLKVAATTAASSTSTGALRVAGGAGIAGKLYTGGNLSVTGTITASSSITTNNHSSAIGTIKSASLTAAKNCSTATDTMICSISLEAGTWVVVGNGRFPANATGYRHINISSTSADNGVHIQVPAVNGAVTQLMSTVIVSPTSTTTYYLNGYQNSGSTLSLPAGSGGLINGLRAVRIA